jgi:hypothetical protein
VLHTYAPSRAWGTASMLSGAYPAAVDPRASYGLRRPGATYRERRDDTFIRSLCRRPENTCGLDAGLCMIPAVFIGADIFPGGGSPVADVFAIAIAIALFALLFWAIDLIDRI